MDYIALGAIAVGLLMLVVVGVLWDRHKVVDGPPPGAPPPPANEPPTFRVVALGLQGTGKTVLLSSLYRHLSFRSERPYYLVAPTDEAVFLGGVRKQILDKNAAWPPSTRLAEDRTFCFDYVSHDAAGTARTILRMSYLEYAGEIFESGDEQGKAKLAELADQVDGAHALLGLIDGFQLRRLLLGEEDAQSYFDAVLLPMLDFMRDATCPIQLVITKWDVLRDLGDGPVDDKTRFTEVWHALMEIDHIAALVRYEGHPHRKMRVIPISAVGYGFADLVDGREPPVKKANGKLDPINIDVPLCAVLPDLLRQVEASLDDQLRRRLGNYLRGRAWQDVGSLVRLLLQSPAGAVLRGAREAVVFLDWMMQRTPTKRRSRRRPSSDAELERLRNALIVHMEQQVQRFEFSFWRSDSEGGRPPWTR